MSLGSASIGSTAIGGRAVVSTVVFSGGGTTVEASPYDWPSSLLFIPQTVTLRQIHNNRISESPWGFTQTNTTPGSRWCWLVDFTPHAKDDRPKVEGFLTRMSGLEKRVRMYDFKRTRPLGTCNLSGVTVAQTASAFSTTLRLTGCGAGATLLAGDWMGLVTGQLVMVVADATADGSGAMEVDVRHMLRSQIVAGSAVNLDRPTALFRLGSNTLDMPRQPGPFEPGISAEFIEVFA